MHVASTKKRKESESTTPLPPAHTPVIPSIPPIVPRRLLEGTKENKRQRRTEILSNMKSMLETIEKDDDGQETGIDNDEVTQRRVPIFRIKGKADPSK